MIVYLYCSYTNSKKGFCLTRLEDQRLVPQLFSELRDPLEQAVDRFLTYDCFRILWQEIPRSTRTPFVTSVCGGMLGLRGLRGTIDDRAGVANVVIVAQADEVPALEAAAKTILADVPGFAAALFARLSLGGPCGYQQAGPQLSQWLHSLWAQDAAGKASKGLRRQKDLLRFAVYEGSWEEASTRLPSGKVWKKCPPQVQSEEGYAAAGGYSWQ